MLSRLFADPESTASIVRRVFAENFRQHRKRYAVAFGLMAVTAGATAFTAWLIRDAVNDIFVEQKLMMVWFFGGLIIALSTLRGLTTYGYTTVLAYVGNGIVAQTHRRIIDKLLRLGIGHFANSHSSGLISRVGNAARAPSSLMNSLITSVGNDLLTLLALLAVMLMQDAVMTVFTLVIAPPIVIGVIQLIRRIRALATDEFAGVGDIISSAQETSAGIRIIKSFNLEDQVRGRAGEAIGNVETKRNAIAKLNATTGPLMESLGGIAVGLALIYAGWQTILGGKTPGEFMAFIVAFLLAYEPAKRLARLRVSIEQDVVMVRILYELLDSTEETPDTPDATTLDNVEGRVELRGVEFAYREGNPVLKGVSLHAEPGDVVALVGPSGGGKSTIVNLIQRFYEPTAGAIFIDGQDIRTVTSASLRDCIAYVSQDPFLFDGTIRENIHCGRPEASDDEVIAAAQAAHVVEFTSELSDGLESHIGENGAMLSGGQRQRVTIARALLKGAPILLLDEATSALDSESERKVQDALGALMKDRTTIVIAHRLSTILAADRICVLRDGEIVEQGDHASLLASDGIYARLFRSDEFSGEYADPGDAAGKAKAKAKSTRRRRARKAGALEA